MGQLGWSIRWHVARVAVGNTTYFAAAWLDGLHAFRREFCRTWSNRWKADDRSEFRQRWERSRSASTKRSN
jgi:hypothetical protein